jgi:hypothetical protein
VAHPGWAAPVSETARPINAREDDVESIIEVPFVLGAAARDSKHDAY